VVIVGARVQLALNVTDIDKAVSFYSRLFDAKPAKIRPGYANFAIQEPPLKLVLIEAPEDGSLNHLGIEVGSVEEVSAADDRMSERGVATTEAHESTCCYARQNKFWAHDTDGTPWEVYTVLADSPTFSDSELEPERAEDLVASPAGGCGPGCC
jgi:catechol 2,3-dioxygenase-like lactoylglutathione lyase family enzyme